MSTDIFESPTVTEPTFEELRAALPAELQGEFNTLGKWMSRLPLRYPFGTGETTYDSNALAPEEKKLEQRYGELYALAQYNLIEVIGWTPNPVVQAPKGFMRRVQETLANLV